MMDDLSQLLSMPFDSFFTGLNDGFEAKSFSVVFPRTVFPNGILTHLKAEEIKTGWFSFQGLERMRNTGLTWFHFESYVSQPCFQHGSGFFNAFTGREEESGKEAALLRLPPLETVHAPLNAHSLSTSRTT